MKACGPLWFDEKFLKQWDVDGFVHFPFVHGDDLIQIPEKLETCIVEGLNQVEGRLAAPRPIYDEFQALVETYSQELSPFNKEFSAEEEDAKIQSLKEELLSHLVGK
mmetsp:Transcript_22702/g.21889  ORF Transcript_22702/g.21889 Transcript_22702/m.21889 type:complete len:107 (+) Transcript_22702:573-893(+)|eukprot:CAMPEP_0170558668 /NCGR_PEP_ID=MMETSP0211-20121228/36940_1 /TAXON_ID=311385 /ORGANISM="Pseudokeronopsis sp., Strain OXSARD2" /LENGTH=106 /DNA_ID=CAMNT_0010870839 /DNA_START=537 /DNA_END=857 /DNA_ORIENTATION=+